ncbi:hypothetical protein NUU61_004000 [Penicillium alfredii]|uniref:Zn(2)-C6 fungal-type domain-containing protein n=1 Tax=Penicillium alfredii TaxID=1506179 RepID=A0A9W9FKG5_9EURO|nr:uncharacterized protein NUU61_004000 [Penicillium alfredii]KAJ5101778.1 hypothetical protein NUU61_004000 [Penicillium alfredii]
MQKSKALRLSTPKVRSGCSTCKTRRIKCDEQKPECLRCTRSNRRCGGYSESLSKTPAGAITAYSIPFKVPGSQTDRQLLHFYCAEVAQSISGFSDPTLWTQLVLQRCHHQPVIRSALVSLSSLYQGHLRASATDQQVSPRSIEAISKCHRQLQRYLNTPQASPEVALICCLIFYVFECLIGDTTQATWHLNQGLALLQRARRDYPALVATPDGIIGHLTAAFSRLDVQASTFDSARVPVLRLVSPIEPVSLISVIPDMLMSTTHAEESLTILQNWTMHHIIAYVEYKETAWSELLPDVQVERMNLHTQFHKFDDAIEKLAKHIEMFNDPQHSSTQRQHCLLLQIHGLMFHSVLLEHAPELADVGMESRIDRALSCTLAFVSVARTTPSSPIRVFTLSTQLIAILYYICMKTQNRQTLQTALSLLQDPSLPTVDGLWNSKTATSIIHDVLPEQGVYGEESIMETKLEDIGSGIVDAGGLDEASRILQMMRKNNSESVVSLS